jgi:DNA polymerase-3 subunit epsilon
VGLESLPAHSARLQTVLTEWQVRTWPYGGPVLVAEGDAWHVLDAWCYLGTVRHRADVPAVLTAGRPVFDKDTYKILVSRLPSMAVEVWSGT